MVVAHALHPVLPGGFERALGADPLRAEPAHFVEAKPAGVGALAIAAVAIPVTSVVGLDVHVPVVVAHVVGA